MDERWVVALLAGVMGLAFGSFLNVCSLRWPVDESVVRPRSRCPRCGTMIRWHDNVPVLGWLVLRGKCRDCGLPISGQYPLTELTTGLVWAGVFWVHGPTPEALRGALFLTILLGISLSDARFYIIPDEFSLGGTVLGVGLAFLPGGPTWKESLIGAAVGFGLLWLVGEGTTWYIRKRSPERLEELEIDSALGGGDPKMMGMVGAFLGISGILTTLFLGSILGLVAFAVIWLWTRSSGKIPFGIYLAAGAAVSYTWGEALVTWYRSSVLLL